MVMISSKLYKYHNGIHIMTSNFIRNCSDGIALFSKCVRVDGRIKITKQHHLHDRNVRD